MPQLTSTRPGKSAGRSSSEAWQVQIPPGTVGSQWPPRWTRARSWNVYTAEGKKEISVKLQGVPKGLDAVSGMVSVYTDDIVYFYNDRGINTCIYNAGEKIQQVHLFNKKQAAVITEGGITIIGI